MRQKQAPRRKYTPRYMEEIRQMIAATTKYIDVGPMLYTPSAEQLAEEYFKHMKDKLYGP